MQFEKKKKSGFERIKAQKSKSGYILATVLTVGANKKDIRIKNADFARKVSRLFLP